MCSAAKITFSLLFRPIKRETGSETPAFTARDAKGAAGLSYRQFNDWEARGALPSQREQEAGWREFSIRDPFVLMICSDIRKRFGVPLEKLARLKAFMLQKDVDHFNAALRMMKYGLAVFILTDLEEIFVMDADFAIAELLELGYCRYDARQAYVFLCVNPLVNRMLAALKEPAHGDFG